MEKLKDLGTINNWIDNKKDYENCREQGHPLTYQPLGRCYTEYSCEICGIKWQVDSSD